MECSEICPFGQRKIFCENGMKLPPLTKEDLDNIILISKIYIQEQIYLAEYYGHLVMVKYEDFRETTSIEYCQHAKIAFAGLAPNLVGTWVCDRQNISMKMMEYENNRNLNELTASYKVSGLGINNIVDLIGEIVTAIARLNLELKIKHGNLGIPSNIFLTDTGVKFVDFSHTTQETPNSLASDLSKFFAALYRAINDKENLNDIILFNLSHIISLDDLDKERIWVEKLSNLDGMTPQNVRNSVVDMLNFLVTPDKIADFPEGERAFSREGIPISNFLTDKVCPFDPNNRLDCVAYNNGQGQNIQEMTLKQLKEITIHGTVGAGAYGIAKAGMYKGKRMIVKYSFMHSQTSTQKNKETEELSMLQREVCLQHFLSISNLAPKIYGYWLCPPKKESTRDRIKDNILRIADLNSGNYSIIIMEYIAGVSLSNFNDADKIKSLYILIIQRVLFMNLTLGICHGDLHRFNIIITEKDDVRFLDFGLAKRMPNIQQLIDSISTYPKVSIYPDTAFTADLVRISEEFVAIFFRSRNRKISDFILSLTVEELIYPNTWLNIFGRSYKKDKAIAFEGVVKEFMILAAKLK